MRDVNGVDNVPGSRILGKSGQICKSAAKIKFRVKERSVYSVRDYRSAPVSGKR